MNILMPFKGEYCSAESASNDLDIDTILSACDDIDSKISQLNDVASSISKTGGNLDAKALSVDGKTMQDSISKYCDSVNSGKNEVFEYTSSIRSAAVAKYNEIQQRYNERAAAENERRASYE